MPFGGVYDSYLLRHFWQTGLVEVSPQTWIRTQMQRRNGFWSSEFKAESVHGSWKLRRTGCSRTEIVDSNSDTRIAIINSSWSGGTLQFSDGRTYRLIYKGFCRPVWTVLTDSGQKVLSLDAREKTVELAETFDLLEDRLLLLAV